RDWSSDVCSSDLYSWSHACISCIRTACRNCVWLLFFLHEALSIVGTKTSIIPQPDHLHHLAVCTDHRPSTLSTSSCQHVHLASHGTNEIPQPLYLQFTGAFGTDPEDRKSTRLNSSHVKISYAVFCLKKK